MLSKIKSFGLKGIDGYPVDVEVDISNGIPKFDIVGLADTAIKESKERVRSAIRNSAYAYPIKRITINLAPADIKKEGSIYDLAIAIGILCCDSENKITKAKDYVIIGELSFDGGVKKVKGLLPLLISAREQGFKNFIVPKENSLEAGFIQGINVYPVESLIETVDLLHGNKELTVVVPMLYESVL